MLMKAKLGSGARFAALKGKLASRPGVTNPGALAAFIGRKKYGKQKFQKLSTLGRVRKSLGK
jgi:hypothetical protein